MYPTGLKWMLPAAVLAGAAVFLSGCAAMHHGYESVTRSSGTTMADPSATEIPATTPPGKSRKLSLKAEPGPAESTVNRAAAIPSPSEIFDFHPGGSAWREPVVLDPNDGPLTSYVQHTGAELKQLLAERKADEIRAGIPKRCSETDVAAQKPRCLGERKGTGLVVPGTGQAATR